MSGPKRNPDKLNTIGVVVVGVCGAVLVYVTIVALQAYYMNDTSEIQTMADYGGQDTTAKTHRAAEMQNINQNPPIKNQVAGGTQTYQVPIEVAMKRVIEDAKTDPSHLIPALPKSDKPTIEPVFGRPKPIGGTGSGSGSAATGTPSAPMTPTGAPGEPAAVPGTGGVPGASTTVPAAPVPEKGNGH
jgi:hypothetical protein